MSVGNKSPLEVRRNYQLTHLLGYWPPDLILSCVHGSDAATISHPAMSPAPVVTCISSGPIS